MIPGIEKRTLGLNFVAENTARVLIWAPFASSLSISYSGKISSLLKKEFGYWSLSDLEIHPGEKYQIIVDNKPFADPASLAQPDGVHGLSMAYNLNSFAWTDTGWNGASAEDLIIYELHTGTFTESGTFDGIREKLSYLKDLGINAIELMPVAQFPGSRNWGYDGVFPYAVQYSYGGPERLQALVDICHKEKIAVILDVVYNHLGPEGNILPAFGPYFTDKYKTPWGQAINYDDEWCDEVRRYFIENSLMWLRDFHIDGLRLDAVHAIKDFGAKHFLRELKENVKSLSEFSGRKYLLIAESDLNDVRYINSFERGGYDMDMQWCDEFHHALHSIVTGEQERYYSDFGSLSNLCKSFNDAFVYDGIYSVHRKRTFGNKTTGLPGSKFVVFSQNHDQIGNRMNGDRLSTLVDEETLKLVAGSELLGPYVPLLFMGEEYGERNPFLYFTHHEDKGLIRAVREGREREFSYSGKDIPDPQSLSTFNNSKLSWRINSEHQNGLPGFYKTLIAIRKNHPVIKNSERRNWLAEVNKNNDVIILTRDYGGNIAICLMNFGKEQVEISLPQIQANLYMLLDSSGENWMQSPKASVITMPLFVKARSLMLLSDLKDITVV